MQEEVKADQGQWPEPELIERHVLWVGHGPLHPVGEQIVNEQRAQ